MKTEKVLYDNELKYQTEFKANLEECKNEFQNLFGKDENGQELITVCAPGRVNLIGEHIDYNEGYVLPMAIPLYTIITGRKNNNSDKQCRVKSLETNLAENNYIEFSLNDLKPLNKSHNWANYITGVCAFFEGSIDSFDAVIKSNVPLGSGLSSSAALEVSTYTFLEHLTNQITSNKQKKALACQKAEHDYAMVPCGIMDQFISTMGVEGNALLIDCKTYESTLYPINDPNVEFLVTNSNVKHQLEGSEYSSRRKQCENVANLLNKNSLREATINELNEKKNLIDEESYRRAKHAITEIARTVEAAEALKSNDMVRFGNLMNQSHDSLRDDFNVSCKELDELVNIARQTSGVLGSRMTGGGFGGCTVTLVKKSAVQDLIKNIQNGYQGNPSFYVCKPCEGARRILNL